jgi:hypothetical protein
MAVHSPECTVYTIYLGNLIKIEELGGGKYYAVPSIIVQNISLLYMQYEQWACVTTKLTPLYILLLHLTS